MLGTNVAWGKMCNICFVFLLTPFPLQRILTLTSCFLRLLFTIKSDSHLPRIIFTFISVIKKNEKQKRFSFSRYLSFCLDFYVMQKKWLAQKDKVNLEIYDVTVWLTNKCNTHIAQYFTNQRQQDDEIWSVNRILQDKYLSSKIIQKMRRGDPFQTCFCFLKKLQIR